MNRILILATCVSGALSGCGGSSSETPFPLEPDFARLDGGPSRQANYVVYTGKQKPESETSPAPADSTRSPTPEPPPER